jgi:hypothetical protein
LNKRQSESELDHTLDFLSLLYWFLGGKPPETPSPDADSAQRGRGDFLDLRSPQDYDRADESYIGELARIPRNSTKLASF